jgi:hypothetical protein
LFGVYSIVRLYGRVDNGAGGKKWVVVQTDANGNNDLVYVTALIQCLKLSLGESPFFAWAGIPAEESVVTQVVPDYYVSVIQQIYAPYFASLLIARRPATTTPTYDVSLITHQGVVLSASVQIAT